MKWIGSGHRHTGEVMLDMSGSKVCPHFSTITPRVWPDIPWKRIHINFSRQFHGKMFVIVVDIHSKWPEVIAVPSTTSQTTTETPRTLFPPLWSTQTSTSTCSIGQWATVHIRTIHSLHMKPWNQAHPVCTIPSRPQVGGEVHANLQESHTQKDMNTHLTQFLLGYRSTAHCTTNAPPRELVLRRTLTHLV